MRLIIGGIAAGKLDRVKALGYTQADIFDCSGMDEPAGIYAPADCFTRPVLYQLHVLVKALLKEGYDPMEVILKGLAESGVEVIICDEIGCGVVPMERFERDYREAAGRICCQIAARAEIVERVYCGIATRIK